MGRSNHVGNYIKPVPKNPFIFPGRRTGRPSPTLFSPWNRIRLRAGLPDLRIHDLRHSYASFLINRGVSLYVVQKLLGHTQIKTTQRYAHLAEETLQGAAEAAGEVVSEVSMNGAPVDENSTRNLLARGSERPFGLVSWQEAEVTALHAERPKKISPSARSETCLRKKAYKPGVAFEDAQRPAGEDLRDLRREGGRLLKRLREARGLSQRELCALVRGGTYTFISQLETGRGRIPPEKLRIWAEALGLTASNLAKLLLPYYDPEVYAILYSDGEAALGRDVATGETSSGMLN
jgi:transcriptional regulator with XRE-family HTH domain